MLFSVAGSAWASNANSVSVFVFLSAGYLHCNLESFVVDEPHEVVLGCLSPFQKLDV